MSRQTIKSFGDKPEIMPELEMRTDEKIYTVEAENWEEAKDKMMDILPIEPFKREWKTPEKQLQEQLPEEKQDDVVRPTMWIYQAAPLNIDYRVMSVEHSAAKGMMGEIDDEEVPEDAKWSVSGLEEGKLTSYFSTLEEIEEIIKEEIIDTHIKQVKEDG
jgi:hypothetical protein